MVKYAWIGRSRGELWWRTNKFLFVSELTGPYKKIPQINKKKRKQNKNNVTNNNKHGVLGLFSRFDWILSHLSAVSTPVVIVLSSFHWKASTITHLEAYASLCGQVWGAR